jgi:hypothetical protein
MPEQFNMSQEQMTEKARELTDKAEKQGSVSEELNNIPFQERAQIAHQMADMNAADRAANSTIPKLEFTFEKDLGGSEHLTNMVSIKDPNAWVFKGKQDVYDMPKATQGWFTPTLTADTLDSQAIRDPDIYTSPYRTARR